MTTAAEAATDVTPQDYQERAAAADLNLAEKLLAQADGGACCEGGRQPLGNPEPFITYAVSSDGGKPERVVDSRFFSILDELAAMHHKKGVDYGAGEDPYANVRASHEWGVPGWQGCMMRANDKMHRLKQFAIKGTLANEGVEDSLIDMAVYSIIGLILFRESKESPSKQNGTG